MLSNRPKYTENLSEYELKCRKMSIAELNEEISNLYEQIEELKRLKEARKQLESGQIFLRGCNVHKD
jgi:hypothetical protein